MTDKTYGLEGVRTTFNSKRLEFDGPRNCWFYVVAYCRKHGYKLKTNRPLSTDIFNQIRAVLSPKAVSSKELYNAIGFHVHSIKYLNRLRQGAPRFNLWGKQEGEVTESEVQFARKKLAEMHPAFLKSRRASKRKGVIVNPKLKSNNQNPGAKKPRGKLTLRSSNKD